MRRGLMVTILVLALTTALPSQDLQQTLIEISTELQELSIGFDEDLTQLENSMAQIRSSSQKQEETLQTLSGQLTTQEQRLDASEIEVISLQESLTDLRSSQGTYRAFVRTQLDGLETRVQNQAREIRRLKIGLWSVGGATAGYGLYRIGRWVVDVILDDEDQALRTTGWIDPACGHRP